MPTMTPITLSMARSAWQVGLDQCYDGPVPRTGNRHAHRDPVWCTWILRSGSVRLRAGNERWQASAGQCVLLPAGLMRDQVFTPGSQITSLRLWIRRSDGAPPLVFAKPLVLATPSELDHSMRALALCPKACNPQQAGHNLACLGQAIAAWWETAQHHGWQMTQEEDLDPRLAAAMAILAEHHGVAPLPWPDLVKATGLSRRQLDRLWAATLGASPAHWHEQRLAERAAMLLRDGDRPIKAVAAACGFTDASHFGRWYRRLHGLSPGRDRHQPTSQRPPKRRQD